MLTVFAATVPMTTSSSTFQEAEHGSQPAHPLPHLIGASLSVGVA